MVLCTLMLLDSRALVRLLPGSRQMAIELFVASHSLLPLMFQDVNRLASPLVVEKKSSSVIYVFALVIRTLVPVVISFRRFLAAPQVLSYWLVVIFYLLILPWSQRLTLIERALCLACSGGNWLY